MAAGCSLGKTNYDESQKFETSSKRRKELYLHTLRLRSYLTAWRVLPFPTHSFIQETFGSSRWSTTDTSFLSLYSASLESGRLFGQPMEVVLGASVAKKINLQIGDQFNSAHGLEDEGMSHTESPFLVVGKLHFTGSVLDQLIITPTESVWHVHGEHNDLAEKEITAMLVKFSSPMGIIQLPRFINQQTNMQAALPVYEINKLFGLLGIGFDMLQIIAWGLITVAGASV